MPRRRTRQLGTALADVRRRAVRLVRRGLPSDAIVLLAMTLLAAAVTLASAAERERIPLSFLTVVLYLGGYLLSQRSLLLLFLVVAALALAAYLAAPAQGATAVAPGTLGVLLVTGILVFVVARSRLRLGLRGTRGESMFVDLRDRLRAQGELPPLPRGWAADLALRNAYGASFSGDFVVASRAPGSDALEVALIDVSGKGADAGSRALLLSGAFGGLLGALPSADFLPATNNYLLRQQWDEGFATAVHLVVDLETGGYCITSAGHPPAVQFVASSGSWRVLEGSQGPLLGVVEDASFEGEAGRLDRGDALLLYTDGVVEVPGRDLSVGIDRLVGAAERLVPRGFAFGATALIDAVPLGHGDDRAILLVWRN